VAIVQGAQRHSGGRVDRFLPDHVVDRLSRDRAAIIQGNSLDHGGSPLTRDVGQQHLSSG